MKRLLSASVELPRERSPAKAAKLRALILEHKKEVERLRRKRLLYGRRTLFAYAAIVLWAGPAFGQEQCRGIICNWPPPSGQGTTIAVDSKPIAVVKVGHFWCPYPGPGNIASCDRYVPAELAAKPNFGETIRPVYRPGIDSEVKPFPPVLKPDESNKPLAPEKVVVHTPIIGALKPGQGGPIIENWSYWKAVGDGGAQVEIRGGCYSACTLVMSHIPKERLCFGERASLNFHLAREVNNGPRNFEATWWMITKYPKDIREWIVEKGGLYKMPYNGFWTLPAKDLWAMGYRRCAQ